MEEAGLGVPNITTGLKAGAGSHRQPELVEGPTRRKQYMTVGLCWASLQLQCSVSNGLPLIKRLVAYANRQGETGLNAFLCAGADSDAFKLDP